MSKRKAGIGEIGVVVDDYEAEASEVTCSSNVCDGLWPDSPAYIQVDVKFADSGHELFADLAGVDIGLFIPLIPILESRLADEPVIESEIPSREDTEHLVGLLRRYADMLEAAFINGPNSYARADGIKECDGFIESMGMKP